MNAQRARALVFALLIAALCCLAQAASVKDGYHTPIFNVPYATTKPVIDGVINDNEWQNALAINALGTTSQTVSARQSTFYLQWDEDNLYVAMRSSIRPGERLIRTQRQTDKDVQAVWDDSYEIWLDVGSHSPDGQPVFFQYLGNFDGARFDAMHEPAVGNMRTGWTAGWKPKNRITPDGKYWEMEVAIPRQSIDMNVPFADGFKFPCLLCRNFKRPWEQNSIGGSGAFSTQGTYPIYILSKTAPALKLAVADANADTLGMALGAYGQADTTLNWSFDSDGGVHKNGSFSVKRGEQATLPAALDLDTTGKGCYRIRVTSTDGATTYLDWCEQRAFGDLHALTQSMHDTGDQVDLNLTFNPVSNYVRVNGDFLNYDARATIARSDVKVTDAAGKLIAEQDMPIDKLAYVAGIIKLPAIPFGNYTTTMGCYDKDGKVILTKSTPFVKQDETKFPWWNTKLGNIERVISPWTPVTYRKGTFGVWGRTMKVGAAGLPAGIETQNHALLAAPMYLTAQMADGRVVKATGNHTELVSKADHRTVVKVTSRLDTITVTSLVTVEFDGMYKVEMSIGPKQAVAVKSLKLVVPFNNAAADYIYGKGEGIRTGLDFGFLPKDKQGRIWDCRKVDSQPMLIGSFIPYVWVGNPNGGLCWFADSDQGWMPNNDVPAVEMRRDHAASTDLVFNFISAPCSIDKPHTITFAFEASPVKPMRKGWRMDTWWTGDTFRDFACVQDRGGDLIFTSVPYSLNPEKTRKMVEAQHNSTAGFGLGLPKYHANAVPYFEHINMGWDFIPEAKYFQEEWETTVSRGLYYGDSLANFIVYHLGTDAKNIGIDGFYVDNVNPLADDNIDAGRGYRLPDGRVQPTYQMFATRKYFLRMRAAFVEQGKQSEVVFHATNNLILPWAGAADIYFDGENNVIFPEMGKDFMDMWPLERLRLNYPEQMGVAGNFLQEYQGRWDPARLKQVMRAYTGEVLLHDVLASGNCNGLNPEAWVARDRFGIDADDVRFIGYWTKNSGMHSDTRDVYLAGWLRPGAKPGAGKLLVAVVNFGEKANADVQIDAKKLGLPNLTTCKIWDAETTEKLSLDAHGQLIVPVNRHDYRQIIIEP